MKVLKRARALVIASVVYVLFRILRATWRLEEGPLPADAHSRGTIVCGHLHEDEWGFIAFFCRRPMVVLVSTSDDGNAMAYFLRAFGFNVSRGSSTRGGASGLLGMLQRLRQSKSWVSLAVDGPRGPRRRVKLGIAKLAQSIKAPVLVGTVVADRAWVFRNSWSKAFVPKPFARVRAVYWPDLIEPLPENASRTELVEYCTLLEERILAVKKKACEATS